ncbi:MAG: hypothetical protein M3N49_03625 [Candidatus Eremiobacteraeota bacterium]|nr:hypothetical protein [Candidatus Eremiobacteraeota bacterium]
MVGRISVLLSLRPLAHGEIAIGIESETARDTLSLDAATLVLTLWEEDAETVRMRIDHVASGTTAYLQATGAIVAMARALDLRLVP